MPRLFLLQGRDLTGTELLRMDAAGMKRASGWRMDRRRNIAAQENALALGIRIDDGAVLGDLLTLVRQAHPALGRRVCDETGAIRRFVNVYVGDDESRTLQGLQTLGHRRLRDPQSRRSLARRAELSKRRKSFDDLLAALAAKAASFA